MLHSRQLSILKNKLLHLDTNSIKEVSVCRSTYINIRKNISPVQIKRALGGAAFAVLLQILPIQSGAQNRAVFNFGSPQFNPFGLQSIQGASITLPALSDLDNDGDVDMIVAYSDTTAYQSIFKYYLNEGTINNPEFVDNGASIFADSIASADFIFSAPVFADLDNDGDQDILAGTSDYASSTYDGKFIFFENTGSATNPQFAAGVDNPFNLTPLETSLFWIPALADIDADGDLDMLASSYYLGAQFFKNSGTPNAPQFDAPIDLSTAFEISQQIGFSFPALADMDNDGDIDIFINDYYSAAFIFFENTGTPAAPVFSTGVQNPGNLSVTQADLTPNLIAFDGDPDLDLFTGSVTGVIYRENLQFGVGFNNLMVQSITVSPTVSHDVINITNLKKPIQQAYVYDMLGRIQPVVISGNTVSIQPLTNGTFHLVVIDNQGEVYTAPFVKQ